MEGDVRSVGKVEGIDTGVQQQFDLHVSEDFDVYPLRSTVFVLKIAWCPLN
jgi:hypothetical protein